jgi:transposase
LKLGMAYKAIEIRLDPETRTTLEGWVRARKTEQRHVRRARIVLLAADGMASRAIAREVGVMTGIVSIWRKRFAAAGIDGLKDKPRPGAKRIYTDATDKRILAKLDEPVPKGRARWNGKLVAKALGDVDIN